MDGQAAFLLRASGHALTALAGPEVGPVLQVGEVDHDEAERAALVRHYAEPDAVPPSSLLSVYCFPCGEPVQREKRTWSNARGWRCATCHQAMEIPR